MSDIPTPGPATGNGEPPQAAEDQSEPWSLADVLFVWPSYLMLAAIFVWPFVAMYFRFRNGR